jgi:hypothetical protein
MCLIFLFDFNQIWVFSTEFYRSPQYLITRTFSNGIRIGTCYGTGRRNDRETDEGTDRLNEENTLFSLFIVSAKQDLAYNTEC